jgi:hypothetical protein
MSWLWIFWVFIFFPFHFIANAQVSFLHDSEDYRKENSPLKDKPKVLAPCGVDLENCKISHSQLYPKNWFSLSDTLVQFFPNILEKEPTKIYCQSATEHLFYAEFDWVYLSKITISKPTLKMETQLAFDSIQVEFAFGDVWGRKSKWSQPIWVKKEFTNQSLTFFLETLFDRKIWKDQLKINRLYFRIISKPEMPFWGNLLVENIQYQ